MGYSPWGRKESDTTEQLLSLLYIDVSLKSEAPELSKVSTDILRPGSNSPDTQSQEQRAWKDTMSTMTEFSQRIGLIASFPSLKKLSIPILLSKVRIHKSYQFRSSADSSPLEFQALY